MRLSIRFVAAVSMLLAACPPASAPETLELSPAALTLAPGEMRTVTAQVRSGTTTSPANGATWTSSDDAVLTVSSTGDGTAALQGVAPGTAIVTAKLRDASASLTVIVARAGPSLTRIELTPASPTLAIGTTLQLTATGIFSDGTTAALTDATWSSADQTLLTVSSTGLVSALAGGSTQVTASKAGVSGTLTVTVSTATLIAIDVTPALPSLPRGIKQQLVATGRFSDSTTQDLSTQVAWTSSNALVTVDADGLATAVDLGDSIVTATLNGVAGSTTITVTAAVLTAIEVTPPAPSIPLGLTLQLTATGRFSDNTTEDLTTQATWSSGTLAHATVSSGGLVTSVALGTSIISAAFGPITGGTLVTVSPAELASISVTPAASTLSIGLTFPFTATGLFTDTTTQDLTTSVTWSSSTPAVASISNAAGSTGLVTALTAGSTTLTATSGTISGSTPLTVTAASLTGLRISPTAPSVPRGQTRAFTAMGLLSDGSMQNVTTSVTWSTGTPAFATISNAAGSHGLLTAVAVGTSTVTATLGTITDNTTVTVTSLQLDHIDVTPMVATVARGRTLQLAAIGVYTDNSTQDLTQSVSWDSLPLSVATISNAAGSRGLLTAVGVGVTTVTATLGNVSGGRFVEVTPAELTSIAVTPASPSVAAGFTRQFTATGTFSDSSTQDLTTQVTWTTGTPAVATASNASGSEGLVTALTAGNSTVIATLGAVTGNTTLTVTNATLVSIAVSVPASLPRGRTANLVATGTYSDASTQVLTTQVTWSSATPAVASVSSTGLATALTEGSSVISATLGSVTGQATLTVGPAALVSIAVTPSTPTLAAGATQQFIATGTYSDASTAIITTQVTWASSATAAVGISNAAGSEGVATAVAAGSSTISATAGSVSGSTVVTVTVASATLVSIAVTPAAASIARGRTQQYVATGTYSDSSTQVITTQVSWSTGTPATATISNLSGSAGLATAVEVGSTTVIATQGSVVGSTTLDVTPPSLVALIITGAPAALPLGRTAQLTATGTYSDASQADLTSSVTWSVSPSATASVSSSGLVTSLAVGTATVTVTLGAISDDQTVNCTAAELVSIAVTPANPTVNTGSTVALTATGTFSDNTTQIFTTGLAWVSQTTAVATVASTGVVTGVTAGTSRIDVTRTGITGSTTVTVVVPAPTVTAALPGNGTSGVRAGAPVSFTFNTAMDVTSLIAQTSAGACTGTLQLSNDDFATCIGFAAAAPTMTLGNTVATLAPGAALTPLATYKLRVTPPARSSAQVQLAATFTQANGFTIATDGPCGASLMISQVYGGAGSASGTFTADYVELHNPGSTPISLSGMALQYASAAGTGAFSVVPLPNVTVPGGGYFLVSMGTGTGIAPIVPDFAWTPSIAMSATAGRVALTPTVAPLSSTVCASALPGSLDFVGYGSTANCSEGGTPTAAPSNTTAVFRGGAGCADTNVNGADFTAAAPSPRNSSTTPVVCACTANETNTVAELDFCVLQFPSTISVAAGASSGLIYTRAFETGVTAAPGPASSIRTEVGFGPAAVNPSTTAGFTWVPASFNVQVGNDDEYQGLFTAPAAGTYGYTGRVSRDGTNWTYCDLDGAGANAGLDFNVNQLGVMTVTP
ncbi:MAG: Ig-like domain-containing protein [Archangium sp.]|nr:Ig-like domain-containing protein [Archangium sp.]MDP3572461.1 Ig-like domain-containing protein [Archangium sp.]